MCGCVRRFIFLRVTYFRIFFWFLFSSNLAMVIDGAQETNSMEDAGCAVCEMAVVWAQNQLLSNRSSEYIKNYLDNVRKYVIHSLGACYCEGLMID